MQTFLFRSRRLVLAVLALALPQLGVAQTANANDPSKVDLRALERQVLAEVNRLRSDPQTLAKNLLEMDQKSTNNGSRGKTFPLADGTTQTISDKLYLTSAIQDAQKQKPVHELKWSEGLYQAARKYAEQDPKGHNDGSTLVQRLAKVGLAVGRVGENINYGGATALNHVYSLYIDDGVPGYGHRLALVATDWTHLGVGCHYPNKQYKDITCVLNYAVEWTELADTPKLEVGKQYALREKAGFRYFKLAQIKRDGGLVLELCPPPSGSMQTSDAGGLTSVEVAQSEGRAAANQPCDSTTTPRGILQNGTALPTAGLAKTPVQPGPTSSKAGTGTATATGTGTGTATATTGVSPPANPSTGPAAGSTTSGSPTVGAFPIRAATTVDPNRRYRSESGNHYMVFQPDGNIVVYNAANQYVWGVQELTRNFGQIKTVLLQPDGNFAAYGANQAYVWSALTRDPDPSAFLTLTPTGVLRLVSGRSNAILWASDKNLGTNAPPVTTPPVTPPTPITTPPPPTNPAVQPLSLEPGKQYALRESGNQFRYVMLMSRDRWVTSNCPVASRTDTQSLPDLSKLLRVNEALAQNLVPSNAACNLQQVPHGR